MSDAFASQFGGSAAPTADDIRRYREKRKRNVERVRERYDYVYSALKYMSEDQLKAINLMLYSCLAGDDPEEVAQQVTFYQGWVSGMLGSKSDGFMVFPDDIFPHFEEEDDHDFEELLESDFPGATFPLTREGPYL